MLTAHAATRLRQRGISRETLELLLTYGRTRHDHRRGMVIDFDHNSRRLLKHRLGRPNGNVSHDSKLLGCYVVVGIDGQIVTIGHRTRRLKID